ncbi:MAG: RDD family protein [Candidatus Bathyarchaeia archaeon]
MQYCRHCGFKLPEDALFCPNCGAAVSPEPSKSGLELASWGERIAAYLIDAIILGFIVIPIISIFLFPWRALVGGFGWNFLGISASFGLTNVVSFLYWTFMEGVYGQSLGKMVLKIKVVRADGKPMDIATAAIESLGKAFLLPIDLILGLIMYPQKQQRLFNYISNTIVVKTQR